MSKEADTLEPSFAVGWPVTEDEVGAGPLKPPPALPSPARPYFYSAGNSVVMDDVVSAPVESLPGFAVSPYSSDSALNIPKVVVGAPTSQFQSKVEEVASST